MRSFGSFAVSLLQQLTGTASEQEPSGSTTAQNGAMNLNLNRTHYLCAGATGLWLLVSKAYAHSHSAKVSSVPSSGAPSKPFCRQEGALVSDEDALFDAAREGAGFSAFTAQPRSLPAPFAEDGLQLDADGLPERFTPSPSSPRQSSPSHGGIILSASNALQQLKSVMPIYHAAAKYEDNFLSLAGARCIFYHFLTLICLFLKVEILVKSFRTEQAEDKKLTYIAECTRRYVLRSMPVIHKLLPEAITCEVLTTCQVEDGFVVHHQDHYSAIDVSWKMKMPSLWTVVKYIAGLAYTYLLNGFYFVFDLAFIAISKLGLIK